LLLVAVEASRKGRELIVIWLVSVMFGKVKSNCAEPEDLVLRWDMGAV
jgi:hypothetical protein